MIHFIYNCNCVYTQVSIHCISFLCQLRGPGSNGTLVAMSTPSVQILASTLQWKGPGADSRAGAGNIQNESGATWRVRHSGSAKNPRTEKPQTSQWRGYVEGTKRANQKNSPRPKLEQFEQQNKVVLDCYPKYEYPWVPIIQMKRQKWGRRDKLFLQKDSK